MKKILHSADIHLSLKEKEYSLSVLSEIINVANQNEVNILLLSGDTFDTFDELVALAEEFKKTIKTLHNRCEVFLLAGNHEDLKRNGRNISSYDLGIPIDNIIDTDSAPYRLIEREYLEILAIPHQKQYGNYTEWKIPPKQKLRIAMVHALNNDLSFTGVDDEEEKTSVMDSDLFIRFNVDYAAFGHIHKTIEKQIGNTIMAYPGSPRVWRKDESGAKFVYLLESSQPVSFTKIVIASAGEYKRYKINVALNGRPEIDLEPISKEWTKNDWIWLDFEGLIEEMETFNNFKKEIMRKYEPQVRKLDCNVTDIKTCANISSQEIARKFLEIWETKKPADLGDEMKAWEKARSIGLSKIEQSLIQ